MKFGKKCIQESPDNLNWLGAMGKLMSKPILGGFLFSLSMIACKEENININFCILKMDNTSEKTF